jgi:hypothetical protein
MLARDLISEVVPALKTSDTAQTALNWMEIFRVSHLPIVNENDYLGLISDSDIYDLNQPGEPIGNHSLSLPRPFGEGTPASSMRSSPWLHGTNSQLCRWLTKRTISAVQSPTTR